MRGIRLSVGALLLSSRFDLAHGHEQDGYQKCVLI